jgi:hypothetical protein
LKWRGLAALSLAARAEDAPVGRVDGRVVNAGLAAAHQAVAVELCRAVSSVNGAAVVVVAQFLLAAWSESAPSHRSVFSTPGLIGQYSARLG